MNLLSRTSTLFHMKEHGIDVIGGDDLRMYRNKMTKVEACEQLR